MTQKMLLGLLVISKKMFNPYLATFACQKKLIKLAIMPKVAKDRDFRHVEGIIMPWTPLNYLRFLAYLFFSSTIIFASLLQAKYKVLS